MAGLGAGLVDGRVQRRCVMAVHGSDHVPAVGRKARRRVVGEPAFHMAVDGDAVVVVERDQLAQASVPASEQASWLMPSIRQPSPRNT
jgi:hypothetical protein